VNVRFLRSMIAPPPAVHDVVIHRPIDEVYRFCRDLTNVARYVGDVDRVEKLSDKAYRWHITPYGLSMTVVVTGEQPPQLLRYATRGPVRGVWEFHFISDRPGLTLVREKLQIPLGGPGRLALAIAGKFPDAEVRDNLARMKTLLDPTKEPR
jgi:uncharacterized membrane protein